MRLGIASRGEQAITLEEPHPFIAVLCGSGINTTTLEKPNDPLVLTRATSYPQPHQVSKVNSL